MAKKKELKAQKSGVYEVCHPKYWRRVDGKFTQIPVGTPIKMAADEATSMVDKGFVKLHKVIEPLPDPTRDKS